MPSDEASNPPSPSLSNSDDSDSESSVSLPEALVFGREKRATAGNKLQALLDAEFQEEEIFKEDEDDEEFERQKSDHGEDFLSSSESSGDEAQDEEEGEKVLLAEQKSEAKRTRERKRKATDTFTKPIAKRRVSLKKDGTGMLTSKPTSTTSSTSRRISFDPALLAARRSSRALTVQTTNETHSRIISAAARRATLPVIPRREQTPPLTQEERLEQAVLTEEENKMSLKRIVEAEEERVLKRREKLEALRRRRFDETIFRFISRRGSLIEEIPMDDEEDVVVDDDLEKEETDVVGIKQEETETTVNEQAPREQKASDQDAASVEKAVGIEAKVGDKMDVDESPTEKPLFDKPPVDGDEQSRRSRSRSQLSTGGGAGSPIEVDSVDVNENKKSRKSSISEIDVDGKDAAESPEEKLSTPKDSTRDESTDVENSAEGKVAAIVSEDHHVQLLKSTDKTALNGSETQVTTQETSAAELANGTTAPITSLISVSLPKPLVARTPSPPKTPPPYHEAYFTTNTVSLVPLANTPLKPVREMFFPSVPLLPPQKPKPSARCPITGLPARYKDPLSGVGYYDIHAFKILREVGRRGGRYMWCSEGGWFVGETGWGGRGAKGVPEGWSG